MRAWAVLIAGMLAIPGPPPSAIAQDKSVLTFHGNESRSGHFVLPALSFEKARSLVLDRSFDAKVTGPLYAQPLLWRPSGSDSGMLLVATENNFIQAIDATTGKELWRRKVGPAVFRGSLPCGNIDPLGITGTPVIDPSTQAIYFDAAVELSGSIHHQVFGLSLKDGTVLAGWPIDVAEALQKSGRHFDPAVQNQRAALAILDDTLFVAFGGHYGDCGNYHGWVVGISLHDANKILSFETRARGGGIWSPGGLSVVGGDLFFATGNTMGAQSWSDGEAVFRLGADLRRSENKKDYFAPSDWKNAGRSRCRPRRKQSASPQPPRRGRRPGLDAGARQGSQGLPARPEGFRRHRRPTGSGNHIRDGDRHLAGHLSRRRGRLRRLCRARGPLPESRLRPGADGLKDLVGFAADHENRLGE